MFFLFFKFKAGDERKISFDNGPEGSKAEDAFFAMVAHSRFKSHKRFNFFKLYYMKTCLLADFNLKIF